MRNFVFCITLIALCTIGLSAQRTAGSNPVYSGSASAVEGEGFVKENLFIEPQVGLNISNQATSFSLVPYLGYSFNKTFAAGAGGGYSLFKLNGIEDKQTSWQASVFTEATIIGEGLLGGSSIIYARAEFGRVSVKFPGQSERIGENIFPVGGGVRMGAGRVSLININVFYNLLYKEGESVFNSPFTFSPSYRWYFLRGRQD